MIRVLVVDDSTFICRRIREILQEDPEMQVVGFASNGIEAVRLATALKPDVITMDVEMPVMDGITAVKKIMDSVPTPILMFSASTYTGAQATLDALNAGAVDFLPKRLDEISGDREMAKQLLRRRVRMVALQAVNARRMPVLRDSVPPILTPKPAQPARSLLTRRIQLLVVVASTGGPVAIQHLLSQIPARCGFPVLIVQHMPPRFTQIFAERLNDLCKIEVREAREGDALQASVALVGPGGMQMELSSGLGGRKTIALRPKYADELYSPCADITLASVAQHYPRDTLVVILTGMGSDGKEGAARLKQQGSIVWAQNEATCTIYGMPKAVVEARLADQVLSLDALAEEFRKFC